MPPTTKQTVLCFQEVGQKVKRKMVIKSNLLFLMSLSRLQIKMFPFKKWNSTNFNLQLFWSKMRVNILVMVTGLG